MRSPGENLNSFEIEIIRRCVKSFYKSQFGDVRRYDQIWFFRYHKIENISMISMNPLKRTSYCDTSWKERFLCT